MLKLFKSFIKDESGLETVEYVLLLTLIVLAMVVGYSAIGTTGQGKLEKVNTELTAAPAG
jgi:Flp pilus assembly pilin Flp